MAISIEDQPYPVTVAKQRLFIVASSDNYTQPGFRYKIIVTTTSMFTFYIAPNTNNQVAFDLCQLVKLRNIEYNAANSSFHSGKSIFNDQNTLGYIDVDIDIYEAWTVDGVLTDDPDDNGPVNVSLTLFNGYFEYSQGYQPSMSSFVMDGDNKRALSDRMWNTRKFNLAATWGLPSDDTAIYIPVLESDYGMFSVLETIGGSEVTQWYLAVCDSDGVLNDVTISTFGGVIAYYPFFPANLNSNETEYPTWPRPSDYPGWKYIMIYGMDDGNLQMTAKYILYNMDIAGESDCKFDRMRLGWVNSRGGWDYQNFTKKSEVSHSIDRKNYKRPMDEFGGELFGKTFQRGTINIANIDTKKINITSDWIQENEFEFLTSLLLSTQIHIVNDDGTQTPVQITNSDYVEKRERNGKLKNLELTLEYSQGQIL